MSGGGIRSNKTVQSKSGGKVEPRSRAVSVESTAQLGASTAFRKPDLYNGPLVLATLPLDQIPQVQEVGARHTPRAPKRITDRMLRMQ